MDYAFKLLLGLFVALFLVAAIWCADLEYRVQQLQRNQRTQVAAYNQLAGIVAELERRLGIPPAARPQEQ